MELLGPDLTRNKIEFTEQFIQSFFVNSVVCGHTFIVLVLQPQTKLKN